MALKKIPDRDQNLLCASLYVNSFKRAVEELVYNSLDAESTSIAIRVCIEKKYIEVLDNGTGISKDNFRLLGDKYATSKFKNFSSLKFRPSKYGFKGISLASIIEISENVKISSKFQNSQETWMKIFHKNRIEEFYLTTLRPSKGTTVQVSGFLYNLNIQQKSIDPISELNGIKLSLEQLALVHCNVSFSLRDDSKNEIIFIIHKNRNIYQTLWSLFQITKNDIQDLQVEKNEYKVKAYIGKNSLASKKYQWIYLNGRVVSKTILHKKINETLTKKLSIKTVNKLKEKFAGENDFNCKIPFYFIFIFCPHFDFDINYNNKQTFVEFKNCEEINKLLEKLVNFYCGDIRLKPLNVREEDNKNNNDTRKKVKEIMDKILNKNDIIPKITQLQNGRKGKHITRKDKKQTNMNSTPQKTIKKSKDNSSKTKKSINITVNKNDKLVCNFFNKKKHEIKYTSIYNKIKPLKTKKIKNLREALEPNSYNETLLKKFYQQTESVKKRCKKLSYQVQNILNKTYMKKQNEMYEIKSINLSHDRNFKIRPNFMLQYSKVAENKLFEKQINKLKTSYDLLKTIENNIMPQKNTFSENKSTDIKGPRKFGELTPNLTFNSHKRTMTLNKRITQELLQRKSHKNLNNLNQILHIQFSKEKNQHNKKSNSINLLKAAILRECKNRSMKMNICNTSSKNVISEDNFTCYSDEIYYITNSLNYNMSCDINSNFENTCTIDVLNTLRSTNDGVNKTYSIQMSTKISYNNYVTNTSVIKDKSIASNKNEHSYENNKPAFITELQNRDQIIEPLAYCEAIIDSNELQDVEREFNMSFLGYENESRDTVLNIAGNNSPTYETERGKSQYFCNKTNENAVIMDNNQSKQITTKCHVKDEITSTDWLQTLNSKTNNIDDFKIRSRYNFVPKGMSQIFVNTFHKNRSIYNIDEECYEDVIYRQFANDVRDKFEIFEPSVKNIKDNVTTNINKVNIRINKENADLIFNSESLKHAKIIGQIDRKFIAARIQSRCSRSGKSSEFLTLFDQHAVDERIRLERNLSDYFDGTDWKSVSLEAFKLNLTQEDCFYLHNYKEKFHQFGLHWMYTNNVILIHAVPKAILGKNPRKAEVIFTAVKRLISEQIGVIKSIRGNVSLYPKSIMDLIFSEACRYAIKFGDQLSRIDCINLISALATCKTPFQCAHGRPVMAIIMELSINNSGTYKINLSNIKKFKKEYINIK